MIENNMTIGNGDHGAELTLAQRQTLREAIFEDISNPDYWDEPKPLAEQLAAIAEAVEVGAPDDALARMAKEFVERVVEWQMENE